MPTTGAPPLSEEGRAIMVEAAKHGGLEKWVEKRIEQLAPGESFTYWCGSLGWDRRRIPGLNTVADLMLVVGVGSMAFAVSDTGYLGPRGQRLGHLTQRRIGPDHYRYQFTKRGSDAQEEAPLELPSPRGRTIYRTDRSATC